MEILKSRDVKMIVIACNTASAYAYEALKDRADVPVVEVVTPGAEVAIRATKNGKIGIIGTKATISTGVYKKAVEQSALKHGIKNIEIFQKTCPLFVSLAEEGWWDNEVTRLTAKEYLTPLKEAGIDTLVMACTHYPLLAKVIGEIMGEGITLVNTGEAAAAVVKTVLEENDIAATGTDEPKKEFFTSDDTAMFESIATPFLGEGLPSGTKKFITDVYKVEI